MAEQPLLSEVAGYRLLDVIGQGGMGVVYLAEEVRLGRRAAVKILRAELANDPGFRSRFMTESRLAASIDHPNIVPIFGAGEADGVLYLAMRYVPGTDLGKWVRTEGRLDGATTLRVLRGVAAALDAAHRVNLVHRDVKPDNILIAHDEEHPYLTDFGLTKHTVAPSGLTRSGQFLGTPAYMAPEQVRDAPIDGRADQYSLACVAYELLTGSLPYPRDSDLAALYAHIDAPIPDPRALAPSLHGDVAAALSRGMAKDPVDRFNDCRELIRALEGALGSVDPAGPQGRMPVAAAAEVAPAATSDDHAAGPTRPSTRARILDAISLPAIPVSLVRPPRSALPRGILVGVAGVLIVAAIGFATAWPWGGGLRSTPSPATSDSATPTSPTGGSLALPRIVARLSPGLYHTELFEPRITIPIGPGWRTTGDTLGAIGLGPQDEPGSEIVFVRIQTVFDDACPTGTITVGPRPVDLISALRARSDLDVTPADSVAYGGALGLQVDVSTKEDICGGDGIVQLFQVANGERGAPPDTRSRLIALEVGGETVAVDIFAEDIDDFWTVAFPLLDSVTIDRGG